MHLEKLHCYEELEKNTDFFGNRSVFYSGKIIVMYIIQKKINPFVISMVFIKINKNGYGFFTYLL